MLFRFLFIVLLAAPAVAQNAAQNAPPPPDMSKVPWSPVHRNAAQGGSAGGSAPTFQVNVKLVNVFASVVDGDGAPYAKLRKEDFRVFEDGVEQKLAVFERESALPLSIVMGLDTSLSTRKDLPLEITSARKFAH